MESYKVEYRWWKEWESKDFYTLEAAIVYCIDDLEFHKDWRIVQDGETIFSLSDWIMSKPPKRLIHREDIESLLKNHKRELIHSNKTLSEIRIVKNYLDDKLLSEGYSIHTARLSKLEGLIGSLEQLLKSIETTELPQP